MKYKNWKKNLRCHKSFSITRRTSKSLFHSLWLAVEVLQQSAWLTLDSWSNIYFGFDSTSEVFPELRRRFGIVAYCSCAQELLILSAARHLS